MHALVRWLASAPGERLLVAIALVALVRQRRLGLKASALIAAVPSFGHPKLALWQAIAAALAHNNPPPPSQLYYIYQPPVGSFESSYNKGTL